MFLDQKHFRIFVVQEVLANEKAQGSRPVNEEVDLDELMDVSSMGALFELFFYNLQ